MKKSTVLFLFFLSLSSSWAQEAKAKASPSPNFEFINTASIQKFVDNYKETLHRRFTSYLSDSKAQGRKNTHQWFLDVHGEVIYQEKFLVLSVSGYEFVGGAHGLPYLDAVYFPQGSQDSIPQTEIFSTGAYEMLSRLSRQKLSTQGFDIEDEWMLKGTAPKPENFRLVLPTRAGVEVVFDSYQVGPYAAGTPTVKLKWSEVRGLIRKKFQL